MIVQQVNTIMFKQLEIQLIWIISLLMVTEGDNKYCKPILYSYRNVKMYNCRPICHDMNKDGRQEFCCNEIEFPSLNNCTFYGTAMFCCRPMPNNNNICTFEIENYNTELSCDVLKSEDGYYNMECTRTQKVFKCTNWMACIHPDCKILEIQNNNVVFDGVKYVLTETKTETNSNDNCQFVVLNSTENQVCEESPKDTQSTSPASTNYQDTTLDDATIRDFVGGSPQDLTKHNPQTYIIPICVVIILMIILAIYFYHRRQNQRNSTKVATVQENVKFKTVNDDLQRVQDNSVTEHQNRQPHLNQDIHTDTGDQPNNEYMRLQRQPKNVISSGYSSAIVHLSPEPPSVSSLPPGTEHTSATVPSRASGEVRYQTHDGRAQFTNEDDHEYAYPDDPILASGPITRHGVSTDIEESFAGNDYNVLESGVANIGNPTRQNARKSGTDISSRANQIVGSTDDHEYAYPDDPLLKSGQKPRRVEIQENVLAEGGYHVLERDVGHAPTSRLAVENVLAEGDYHVLEKSSDQDDNPDGNTPQMPLSSNDVFTGDDDY